MPTVDIIKGVDKEIEFTILDSNSAPINPSTVIGIVVVIYYDENNDLVKYSKNSKVGYENIITGYDDSNGKIKILLESATTKDAKRGLIYAEVKLQTTNAAYVNNTYNEAATGIEIGRLIEGLTKNDTDLS